MYLLSVPAEKPAQYCDAGSSLRCGKGIFSQSTNFSADYLTVSVEPPRAITFVNICALVRNPKHCPLLGHTKILHTLTEMGSAALAAAVPR